MFLKQKKCFPTFIILGNGWKPQDWPPAASFVSFSKRENLSDNIEKYE